MQYTHAYVDGDTQSIVNAFNFIILKFNVYIYLSKYAVCLPVLIIVHMRYMHMRTQGTFLVLYYSLYWYVKYVYDIYSFLVF